MTISDVLVAGLGNPLMGDEGVGPRVVDLAARRAGEPPGIDFLDLGTPGLALLHALRGRRRVVLVDCAMMGAPPGTIRRFTPAELRPAAGPGAASLHEPDLPALLRLARRLGERLPEIVIFGIQPLRIEPGVGLSPALEARLADYAGRVVAEVLPAS
ncbi:MAG: hydrogenase maturation protease [Candidatus Brocadiaceae bacterium]|nr:hydrogenase maturation protease [Candidatus Brocadiaceae bacterium]